ncbi:MAG: homocysteine S-methyltransferase family protein [Anaerolineales bacterium]|nr:homocysteine S-methyltransferase family protein [Anaerolineales bacterium]
MAQADGGRRADIRARGLLERLAGGETLLADGAMGTLLMARGLEPGSPPEAWNTAHPRRIAEVHRAYVDAGSQIILTNTFGGSRIKLAKAGLGERAEEINRAAAVIALEAAGGDAFVAGDIGPCGEMMEPLGALGFAEAVDNFARQARALAESGVDLLWVETMMDLEEARAAVAGAKQASGLPVFCSMSFGAGGRTIMGVSAAQALEALKPLGPAAFGANCGEGLDVMDAVVGQLLALAPGIRLIAKPNAGLPRLAGGQTVYDVGPQEFARRIGALVKRGARIVGGCCGSNPDFIAAVARAIAE